MKSRPVFLGVLVAGLGVALLALYMRKFELDASGGSKVELLVAVSPIPRGTPVTSEMLGTKQVPQAYVDERSIRASERAKILNLKPVANIPVLQTLIWSDFVAASDHTLGDGRRHLLPRPVRAGRSAVGDRGEHGDPDGVPPRLGAVAGPEESRPRLVA